MKLDLKPYPLIHPATIVLVGTMINGLPNHTTIGDIAVAGLNPPLIMISLHENHNAMTHINDHHRFIINLPTKDMLEKVDYAGVHSSKKVDKSKLFDCEIVDGLPLIKEAPISLIVTEQHRHQIKHRVVLICEVVRTIVKQELIHDGKLDLSGISPVLYGLDNGYYTIGARIGTGYEGNYEPE